MVPATELPPGFERVRLIARLVSWALLALAAFLAGPHLYAVAMQYEALTLDGPVVAGIVCVLLSGIAGAVARSIASAQALRRAEGLADAGIGEAFVYASRDPSSADFYRAVSADRQPPLPAYNRLADAVIEREGASGLIIGVVVFCWLFGTALILGFDRVFEGRPPSLAAIIAMLVLTVVAIAFGSLRYRKTLSNRDKAVHTDLACVTWHRRTSRPLSDFYGVTVYHDIGHERSSSSSRSHSTRRVDLFRVGLLGSDEMVLLTRRDPFLARRRARQVADYLKLPLVEPDVDDPSSLPLYKG